jgi:predicted nucleic acid-binding protein
MSRIFLDTNIFIYLIEDEGDFGQRANELITQMSRRRDEVITSAITLGEVLVKPTSGGRHDLVDIYEELLHSPGIHIADFDQHAARRYAEIRADRTIKSPDAIQLAVAANFGCDLFITNDDRLSKKIIPGIHFIASFDRPLF